VRGLTPLVTYFNIVKLSEFKDIPTIVYCLIGFHLPAEARENQKQVEGFLG